MANVEEKSRGRAFSGGNKWGVMGRGWVFRCRTRRQGFHHDP